MECYKPRFVNQDPASVVYEGLNYALENEFEIVICDTAGRLQNKVNLMNELNKIHKVIATKIPYAPHETLLVLDATIGQNGVKQALSFYETSQITGIIITKMDGTAKGGILLTVYDLLKIPIKFLGLGEQVNDLQKLDVEQYFYNLVSNVIDNSEV